MSATASAVCPRTTISARHSVAFECAERWRRPIIQFNPFGVEHAHPAMQVVPCRSDGLEFELQAYAVRIRYTSIDGLQVLRVLRHRGRPQLFPVGTAHKLGQLVSHIGDAHLIVHMQLRCE
jgi:hypothetical protein